jgi:hypothetical protein
LFASTSFIPTSEINDKDCSQIGYIDINGFTWRREVCIRFGSLFWTNAWSSQFGGESSLSLLPASRPVVRAHPQGRIASCGIPNLRDGLRPQVIIPCAEFQLLIQHRCSQRRYVSIHPGTQHHIINGQSRLCIAFSIFVSI